MNHPNRKKEIVIILDCGATNIRAIAVDGDGKMCAEASQPNATEPGSEQPDYHIWPLETIWEKLTTCCTALVDQLKNADVAAIGVTTFGVDGTVTDPDGELKYPIISWKCPRTEPIMAGIDKYIDMKRLRKITGLGSFSYNTIFKLVWLKENRPDIFDANAQFLFISSLINHRLTGRMTSDFTMLGTSMLTDQSTQKLSDAVLEATGLNREWFPPCVYPGEQVGELTKEAADALGLVAGTKVISCGHDTQFALYGSGAGLGDPVLSSGTWEILMIRAKKSSRHGGMTDPEVTSEFDCIPGNANQGVQWLASERLEKLREALFKEESAPEVYETMIREAGQTERGKAYLDEIQSLSKELQKGLHKIVSSGMTDTKAIRIVGGGAKNRLWNQLKANATGLPLYVLHTKETTVLGAAFFTLAGAGIYPTAEAARELFEYQYDIVKPE